MRIGKACLVDADCLIALCPSNTKICPHLVVTTGMGGNNFNPVNATISAGQSVGWKVVGGTHNVQSNAGLFCSTNDTNCNAPINMTSVSPGYGHTFTMAGTFNYKCTLHGAMTGVVTVQ